MSTATEVPQCMQALAVAVESKEGHGELKRELRDRVLSVEEALVDPRAKGRLTIAKLLRGQHYYGHKRVRRVLVGLGISESRRVDQLTERQRRLIVRAL